MEKYKLTYTSENGYTGVLYGQSSLKIYAPDGRLSFHTGFRSINTYEELKQAVDEHPDFIKKLHELCKTDPEGEEVDDQN